MTAEQAKTAVIAYEPIWAIGTGKVATTEQAEEVCGAIRACIKEVYDEATAEAIRIQYGGSVSAASAPELFAQPDIDGGLVGGASLKADFGKIVIINKRWAKGGCRTCEAWQSPFCQLKKKVKVLN